MNHYFISADEQIQQLKNELSAARYTIIHLMPETIQPVFQDYYQCQTSKQHWQWEAEAVHKVIEMAVPLSPAEGSHSGPRARCPLCGADTNSPYERGFSLPEGLLRHLEGKSNANQCPVLRQVFGQAWDYLRPKLQAADQAEREEQHKKLEQRRAVEPLYMTALGTDPLLLDESLGYGNAPRNEAELAWAEQRLSELGFLPNIKDRVRQYALETEQVTVLADPRQVGEISFRVYRKPLPKNGRAKLLSTSALKDSWKHDIKDKFQARLANSTV